MVKSPSRKNNLKKSKLIFIFILSMLLISSLIYTSSARESTGVEVQKGERYKWSVRLNISNYIELIRNTGDGTVSPEIVEMSLTGNENDLLTLIIIIEILDTDENFNVDSFFDVETTLTEARLTISPDFNISKIPIFHPLNFSIRPSPTRANFSILKGDTPNYFSIPIGFFLIVPIDLDWITAAAELQSHIGRKLLSSNYTVSRQEEGLRMVQPANATVLASELNLNYNSKGVLETADGSYDGSFLFSMELESDDSIAFELPFLLSITAIAIAILLVRKGKKYTLNI